MSGSAVAVERIFSSGRDSVSMRRARLQPETIRTLMLVKHRLERRARPLMLSLTTITSYLNRMQYL